MMPLPPPHIYDKEEPIYMPDLNDILNLFDSTPSAVLDRPEQGEYEEVPDGKYRVELVSLEAKTTRNGDPYVGVKCKVMDRPHAGRYIFPHQYLSTDQRRIAQVKRALKIMGADPSIGWKAMVRGFSKVTGTEFTLTKKTNGKYTNYFFDPIGAKEKTDDVPF